MKIPWRKLPATYQMGIFFATAVLAIVLFWQLALEPMRTRSTALAADIAMEQQRITIVENFALTYPDAAAHAAQMAGKLALNNRLLPDGADLGGVLVLMEEAARVSGVHIGQIQPGKSMAKNNYQEIPIALTVKGNYYQLLDFTRRLEGAQRFAAISLFHLQAKDGALAGKITVNVYFYAQGMAMPQAAGQQNANPPLPAP